MNRPKKKSERELLERLVEQGDESYAQQGRTLGLLNEIWKELGNMTVDTTQIHEALDRIEGNTDNIQTFMETTATEIAALKTEVQALKDQIAAGGTITEAEAQAILDRVNTIDAAQDAALAPPTEEPPIE